MPQYASTDPNFGAESYVSTDPNFGTKTYSRTSITDMPSAPDWKQRLSSALTPLAHPQTASDIASLLIPGEATGLGALRRLAPKAAVKGVTTLSKAGERRVTDIGAPVGLAERRQFGIPSPAPSDLTISASRQNELLQKLGGRQTGATPATKAAAQPIDINRLVLSEEELRQKAHQAKLAEIATQEALPAARRQGMINAGRSGQRGAIPTGTLLKGTAIGGGTAVGASQNPEHPVIGGVAGGLLAAGAVNPSVVLKGVEQARHLAMLSGGAVPKSLLNNMSAPVNAAIELRSLKPLTEAARLPTNIKNWARAIKTPPPYQGLEASKTAQTATHLNPFMRQMSAADEATRLALTRGGVSAEDANRLLLQTPLKELGVTGKTAEALSGAGRVAFPYTRNAFNQFVHGVKPKRLGLAASYGALGAGASEVSDDPRMLGLAGAVAGPYALPFYAGAAINRMKPGLLGQMSPLPEFGLEQLIRNPLQQFEPAALRWLK